MARVPEVVLFIHLRANVADREPMGILGLEGRGGKRGMAAAYSLEWENAATSEGNASRPGEHLQRG